jgi:hypothetical protein
MVVPPNFWQNEAKFVNKIKLPRAQGGEKCSGRFGGRRQRSNQPALFENTVVAARS